MTPTAPTVTRRHPPAPCPSPGRRPWWRAAIAPLLIAVLAVAAMEPALAGGPARGLIVQLKDDARVSTLGSPDQPAAAAALRALRVAAVARAAGVPGVDAERPVGRSAHLLDFGRVLGEAEAARWADQLRARPEVAWVVPNEMERRLQVPNDPQFPASGSSSGQWWLFPASGTSQNAIGVRRRGAPGVQAAWTTTTGSRAAVVAVLDTGSTSHPELTSRFLPGHDFVSTVEYAGDGDGRDTNPADPGDGVTAADRSAHPALFTHCPLENSSWHGTVIAGIVGAATNNGAGVAGVNWDARVLPVRVAGKCGAELADIVDGMRWAAGLSVAGAPVNANRARIVNISFGGSAACNSAYQDAIDELARAGTVVVAAAGNEHVGLTRPASCRGVIGVVALNRDGFKASYSNFGSQAVIATLGGDPVSESAWGAMVGDDGLLTL